MNTLNKHSLIGRIGQTPIIRVTQSGKKVAEISIATDSGRKDPQTNKQITDWHKCVAWDKIAEFIEKYLSQGSFVYAEGPCVSKSFKNKDGVLQYIKETTVYELKALSPLKQSATVQGQQMQPVQQQPAQKMTLAGGVASNIVSGIHSQDEDEFFGNVAGMEHTEGLPPIGEYPY